MATFLCGSPAASPVAHRRVRGARRARPFEVVAAAPGPSRPPPIGAAARTEALPALEAVPRRAAAAERPSAAAAAGAWASSDVEEEGEEGEGASALEFALSALAALPAWLSPFSRAGGALDDAADASLFFPADDADAFGDAGLAVWLAQRAQR